MADEQRRSARSTKGQHTKNEFEDAPATKKKGGKKGKKTKEESGDEEEEDDSFVRCVCGATESPDGDPEAWIGCEKCPAWQHNVCVGVSTFEEDLKGITYFCEQCKPSDHKELLDARKKGIELWKIRQENHKKEVESNKKGKKAKGKRASEVKLETPQPTNGKAKSPIAQEMGTTKVGNGKKNARDDSEDIKQPQSKKQKTSTPQPKANATPAKSPEPAVGMEELDPSRKGFAQLLQKSIGPLVSSALAKGTYKLSTGDSAAIKSERLSLQIEEAISQTHADKTAYQKQARTISSNLKTNPELVQNLLSRRLTPSALAVMTGDDLASSEQKREAAEMKARADKQAILINDDGPRMRRTHKGDELIENDAYIDTDTTISNVRRRSTYDQEAAARSRDNSPGNEVELPDGVGMQAPRPPKINTKQEPTRKASETNFDISKVLSTVQSPTIPQGVRRASSNVMPRQGAGVDADVDRMLQDENDSPPYSPAEYPTDPDVIWKGTVVMDSVSKYSAVAKHVAGADLSKTMPWNDLLPKELKIAGRISVDHANEYLCSLRYSPQTDVVVVEISPFGEATAQDVKNLYDYFTSKSRYGVLTSKGLGNVRDTYLIPLEPSPAPLPDFITNLEGHRIPENRLEPSILVALVIRNDYIAPQQPGQDVPLDQQAPQLVTPHQRQMSVVNPGPAMSPLNAQGAFAAPTQAQAQEVPMTQQQGEAVGIAILGDRAADPTIGFLMPQAANMRVIEWHIIKEILDTDKKARVDLQHLSMSIETRMKGQGLR